MTVFYLDGHCHVRGQTGIGTVGVHARKEQRFICHECHKTFSVRTPDFDSYKYI
jgi:transposase-like protein